MTHRANAARETPPRAWGRLITRIVTGRATRNTPTGVGKTHVGLLPHIPREKHPHGRGEDQRPRCLTGWSMETPPRAWGRPGRNGRRNGDGGNTPTGVGKTGAESVKLARTKKHPHGRGEDPLRDWKGAGPWETPPRAWGRPYMRCIFVTHPRNTPTGVGKTYV